MPPGCNTNASLGALEGLIVSEAIHHKIISLAWITRNTHLGALCDSHVQLCGFAKILWDILFALYLTCTGELGQSHSSQLWVPAQRVLLSFFRWACATAYVIGLAGISHLFSGSGRPPFFDAYRQSISSRPTKNHGTDDGQKTLTTPGELLGSFLRTQTL